MSKVVFFSMSALLLTLTTGLIGREVFAARQASGAASCECGECESGCDCCLGEACNCATCGCGDCDCVVAQSPVQSPKDCEAVGPMCCSSSNACAGSTALASSTADVCICDSCVECSPSGTCCLAEDCTSDLCLCSLGKDHDTID